MKCNYSEGFCRKPVETLLLTICPEGHIRENYLCAHHHVAYLSILKARRMICLACGQKLTGEYLEKNVV